MPVRYFKPVLAAALALAALAAPASSATINEGSFAGGDFSGAYASPSSIATGKTVVNGTLTTGDYDFLAFTGMLPGAQTLTFDFTTTAVGSFLSAGTLRYSTTPFTSNGAGSLVGNIVLFDAGFFSVTSQTLTLNLGSGFTGALYLALNLAGGPAVSYSLGVPGNIAPAPVPLPGAALLLAGAVGGLGAAGRRRRSRAAA